MHRRDRNHFEKDRRPQSCCQERKGKGKMDFIFGSRKTPQEMLRENQRMITKSVRELDRERAKLEQQEKKLVADIKKSAKAGQMVSSPSIPPVED